VAGVPETMSEATRTGGCQCGRVRYRIVGEPKAVTACHCTECQRQSGSAFGMSAIVEREQLTLEAGDLRSFSRVGDSGLSVESFFCGECGTRIYHRLERMPGTLNVKAGTLDDTRSLSPAVHVWLASKQAWVLLPEGVPRFERNPGKAS
jgi:hypothetical protein